MAVNFSESRTKENLMRAFAERARRATDIQSPPKRLKKKACSRLRISSAILLIRSARMPNGIMTCSESFPAKPFISMALIPSTSRKPLSELLRAAEHNEHEEYADVYQAFGDTAKEEGFHEAASAFFQIAEVEHIHEIRFAKLAELLENNTYYGKGSIARWMCTNCGYIHEGQQAPPVCPVCRHEKGYFIPYAMACYKVDEI